MAALNLSVDMIYTGQKHRYRVHLSGLDAASEKHYRRMGGLVVLAVSEESARRTALRAERMTRPASSGIKGRVRVVGVVDLGHAGTDDDGCKMAKRKAMTNAEKEERLRQILWKAHTYGQLEELAGVTDRQAFGRLHQTLDGYGKALKALIRERFIAGVIS